jgi:ABC-type multidrug transport system permease subunit
MIDKLIKEFPRALVISTFVFIILFLLKIVTGVAIEFNSSLVVFYLYTTLYSFSLYYANAFLFIVLDEQFVHNRFSAQRIGLGLLFSFLISTVIIFSLRILEDVFIEGESWNNFINTNHRFDYLISIVKCRR